MTRSPHHIFMSILLFLLPMVAIGAAEPSGAQMFRDKGCIGCHSVGGQGGHVGPALDSVGDRYAAEWIYRWLKNPAAVKPGTAMPNLHLTDRERAFLVFYLLTLRTGTQPSPPVAAVAGDGFKSNPPDLNPNSPEDAYLKLGVGKSYVKAQRSTLQDQIQAFIPPIYEPAFTGSAFVLPPGAMRMRVMFRGAGTMDEDDISGERDIGARFVNFKLERQFIDFDFFLGLEDNYTMRVNIPFRFSRTSAELKPGFFEPVSVFPQGSTTAFGDVSVFLKKKFIDQGNAPVGVAGAIGLSLPTGSNSERFDARTTVNVAGTDMLLPFPAVDGTGMPIPGTADGTFRRFSNDGRLPSALQPGLGTVGGTLALFITRQFEGGATFGRGALHAGVLYTIRPKHDGIDPGDLTTGFVTLVKPLMGDKVSLDLTYLAQRQDDDSYDGKMLVPTASGPQVVSRPSFTGGTTQFFAPSIIWIPNPLFRVALSGLLNVGRPDLGPSPPWVIGVNFQYTFASGLFQSGE